MSCPGKPNSPSICSDTLFMLAERIPDRRCAPPSTMIPGILSGFLFGLLFLKFCLSRKGKGTAKAPPQVSGAWPLLGNVTLLKSRGPLYRVLAAASDKYGPAFTFQIGMRCTILVISSWEFAKDCFTTNDKLLATRPQSVGSKHMGYNDALITFAPYGPYWREVRKLSTLQLLSNYQLEKLKHVRAREIQASISVLYKQAQGKEIQVEMIQWLKDLTFNVVLTLVAGKRYYGAGDENSDMRQFQKAVIYSMHLASSALLIDVFPFLERINYNGYIDSMKSTAKDLDSVLSKWLEEHRLKTYSIDSNRHDDFMDVMISSLEGVEIAGYHNDAIIKANCLAMILGATDSTSTTVTWALSLLLNDPNMLNKAQEELDRVVGKERNVDEADIPNLIYLQAIVKETLRIYPALPLAVPHEAQEDCTIGGYNVPAGTRVMVNLWKLHRDPRVWSKPLEFRPDRFMMEHADVDVRGQHFEYMPFGSGRRACPGISFGVKAVQIILARILHAFDVAIPSDSAVDMSESEDFGLIMSKKTPLDVILSPRLSSKLLD